MLRWSLAACSLLVLTTTTACRRETPEPAAAPAPRTSPAAPGAPMDLSKPDEVRVRLDLDNARSALRMHQQEHGNYPADLGALSLRFNYPDDLTYDPGRGEVHSKTYPRL